LPALRRFCSEATGRPVCRHAANARGSFAPHIEGFSQNADGVRDHFSRWRRPTHDGPGALKAAIFCRSSLRRKAARNFAATAGK
jgi:hypothetical protein